MRKFFNTTGPCIQGKHYMIDPFSRFKSISRLIEEERYFTLHAPRQTGKTTTLLNYVQKLQQQDEYIALYVNIEAAQPLGHDIISTNNVVVNALARHAELLLPEQYHIPKELLSTDAQHDKVYQVLSRWCSSLPKPVILFIDEIDSLYGDGLISLLRQLRTGYLHRPNAFPSSLGLVGVRDLRDYRITTSSGEIITGGSAFNIKDESLSLRNFLFDEVVELYHQHTEVTGQEFTNDALSHIYEKTLGQPWLVNALGKQLVQGDSPVVPSGTVDCRHVEIAVEQLILRRDVHLDQLADKLSEPRVMPIIQSILIGESSTAEDFSMEELQYVLDLGLIRKGFSGWEMANPIYKEVIPRELTYLQQTNIAQDPAWYQLPNGNLNMDALIREFIVFYKRNAEILTNRKTYTEAAHHLVFMAFLQRIVNGGGRIEREYASCLGRVDIMIQYGTETHAIELKLYRKNVVEEASEQLYEYLQRLSVQEGWLLIFRKGLLQDWENVGMCENIIYKDKTLHVVWM